MTHHAHALQVDKRFRDRVFFRGSLLTQFLVVTVCGTRANAYSRVRPREFVSGGMLEKTSCRESVCTPETYVYGNASEGVNHPPYLGAPWIVMYLAME